MLNDEFYMNKINKIDLILSGIPCWIVVLTEMYPVPEWMFVFVNVLKTNF